MDQATRSFVEARPYLEGVARFQAAVDEAVRREPLPAPGEPSWERWTEADRRDGQPLLRSGAAASLDLGPAGDVLCRVAAALAKAPVPDKLAAELGELAARLAASGEARTRAMRWVATGEGDAPEGAGLVRFLGWRILSRALAPVIEEAALRRGEQGWTRPHCPTCGAPPLLAQVVSGDGVSTRLLACAACRTRWRWKRIACPHCGEEDQEKLSMLGLDDEPRVALSVCETCKGYVKTYDGAGEEGLYLADWTSLALDAIARERGLEKRGASLYDL